MERIGYAVSAILSGLAGMFGLHLEEQPAYDVLVKEGAIEIRRYAPYVAATTEAEGSYESGRNVMFNRLAGYIFGENRKQEKIEMTAPVVAEKAEPERIPMTAPVVVEQGAGTWRMSFMLPSRYTLETAPVPTDPRVTIHEVPPETLAVIRFSGPLEEAAVEAHARTLSAWLGERSDYVAVGPHRYAGYDPPWAIPFLRRNEVMIPVEPVAAP